MRARQHGFGRGDGAAHAAQNRFPGAGRHRGVAVDESKALTWRDVAQLINQMIGVAQRGRIERTLRRQHAGKGAKAFLTECRIDGAQPIRTFRMPGRHDMIEACGMGNEKRGHSKVHRAGAREG